MEDSGQPAGGSGTRSGVFAALACLFFSLATALQLPGVALHPAGLLRTGNHADLLFSIWRVAWFGHQAGIDPARIYDANIFFPSRLAFAYSDPAFFAGLAGWPLIAAFSSPAAAYNLVLMGTFAATGVVSALFFRRLLLWLLPECGARASAAAALLASFAFTYQPYRFAQLQSIEHLSCQWFGLLFLLLLRYARGRHGGDLALLAGAFSLQLFSSMTNAAYAALALLLFGVWLARRDGDLLRPRRPALAVAGVVGFTAVLIAVYHPFWELYREAGMGRSLGSNVAFSAHPAWFASIDRVNPWHDALLGVASRPRAGGYPLFPGFSLLALAALSFALAPRPAGRRPSRATLALLACAVAATALAGHEIETKCGAAFFDEMDTPAAGFHDPERSGGTTVRWSGGQFAVPLRDLAPGRDVQVFLRAATHRPAGLSPARLRGTLDGRAVIDLELPAAGMQNYAAVIPGSAVGRPGTSEIVFATETWSPSRATGSADGRELGILIDALSATQGSTPLSWRLPGRLKALVDDWLLLCAAALWLWLLVRWTRPLPLEQRAFLLVAALAALLALGPLIVHRGVAIGRGPYDLLYRGVFLFQAFRVPHRTAPLWFFSLSALAAIGIARLASRFRAPAARAGAVALCAGALALELFNTTTALHADSPRLEGPPPEVYEWLGRQQGDFGVLELPIPRAAAGDAELMYWSTRHWKRLVNGYSGHSPGSYRRFQKVADRIPDAWFFDEIRRLGVRLVIYHAAADAGAALPALSAARDAVRERARFGTDLVFEVTGSGDAPGPATP